MLICSMMVQLGIQVELVLVGFLYTMLPKEPSCLLYMSVSRRR